MYEDVWDPPVIDTRGVTGDEWRNLIDLENRMRAADEALIAWEDRNGVDVGEIMDLFLAGRLEWTDELNNLASRYEQARDAYADALYRMREKTGRWNDG
jgi:hypothetical protein